MCVFCVLVGPATCEWRFEWRLFVSPCLLAFLSTHQSHMARILTPHTTGYDTTRWQVERRGEERREARQQSVERRTTCFAVRSNEQGRARARERRGQTQPTPTHHDRGSTTTYCPSHACKLSHLMSRRVDTRQSSRTCVTMDSHAASTHAYQPQYACPTPHLPPNCHIMDMDARARCSELELEPIVRMHSVCSIRIVHVGCRSRWCRDRLDRFPSVPAYPCAVS